MKRFLVTLSWIYVTNSFAAFTLSFLSNSQARRNNMARENE